MDTYKMTVKIKGLEVFGRNAIYYINEKIEKDLEGTDNTVEIVRTETAIGETFFTIETNFANPVTVGQYFTKFVNRRKRFIKDKVLKEMFEEEQ